MIRRPYIGVGKCRVCGSAKSLLKTAICVECKYNQIKIGSLWVSRGAPYRKIEVLGVDPKVTFAGNLYVRVHTTSSPLDRKQGSRLISFWTLLAKYYPVEKKELDELARKALRDETIWITEVKDGDYSYSESDPLTQIGKLYVVRIQSRDGYFGAQAFHRESYRFARALAYKKYLEEKDRYVDPKEIFE